MTNSPLLQMLQTLRAHAPIDAGRTRPVSAWRPHKQTGIDVALALLTRLSARSSWTNTACAIR